MGSSSPNSSMRSVASVAAVEDHILDILEQLLVDVLVDLHLPALTMPMSMPALIAWYRKAEWIASRTRLLPRKEKERLETPPEILRARAGWRLISRVASMKSLRSCCAPPCRCRW